MKQPPEPLAAAIEPISETRAMLGESPAWSARQNAVWWVDIDGRRLHRTEIGGDTQSFETPEFPGFVQPVGDAVFVGMQSGVFRFDPGPRNFALIAPVPQDGQRFNDACLDARGRIWAGTMCLQNKRSVGVLYRFTPETGALEPVDFGFRTVNGLAWDAGQSRLFVSDSNPAVQRVWTCTVQGDGAPGPRRDFADFRPLPGRPDGAMVDGSGAYWIAGIDGGEIYRFAPDGTLTGRFTVPMRKPTKPAEVDTPDGPALVLTSFADGDHGGRLCLWRAPPLG